MEKRILYMPLTHFIIYFPSHLFKVNCYALREILGIMKVDEFYTIVIPTMYGFMTIIISVHDDFFLCTIAITIHYILYPIILYLLTFPMNIMCGKISFPHIPHTSIPRTYIFLHITPHTLIHLCNIPLTLSS